MESNIQKIEHVVVLMLENRSFDSMLGWLMHPDGIRQKVNGVAGKGLTNPIPRNASHPEGLTSIPVSAADPNDMTHPNPDPGEEYSHVNTQLFGSVIPEENSHLAANKAKPPYNLPPRHPATAPMNGFVIDYINSFRERRKKEPTFEEYKIIMDCFPEEAVPVMSGLAKEYAVFDAWFAPVPSQTLCNRSFVHAATSHGYVLNGSMIRWMLHSSPTLYDRIDAKKGSPITWRVYYDKLDILPLIGLQYPKLLKPRKKNFRYMEDFINDAAAGSLPNYAFIEPRFLIDHNDQHPPIGETLYETSSVLAGEQLIERIYNAVRTGPKWENTLHIITYDEHGGCYDHVAPPTATPPDPKRPTGEQDFKFDRLGIRVPTIMVSPYIQKGTVISDVHDHTSIIKFLCDRWGLESLTERDKAAVNFHEVLNLPEPDFRTGFELQSRPYHGSRATLDEPINDLQKTILFLLAAIEDWMTKGLKEFIIDEKRVAHIKTIGQAVSFTIDIDRRVTKHISLWDWVKMKIRMLFKIVH